MRILVWVLAAATGLAAACSPQPSGRSILNVSYDATREYFEVFNREFEDAWFRETGERIVVNMSHGGSGKQARAVRDGLEADVITLALGADLDLVARDAGALSEDWREELPAGGAPFFSTIVFVVREGNPNSVRDWGDLTRPGVQVVTSNPKTSGGARWAYLAAWAWADAQSGGREAETIARLSALFRNVPVLDTGARGAVTTFAQRALGDVLVTWESEALLIREEFGEQKFEIVYPSVTIRAEPVAAVARGHAERHGVADIAEAYAVALFSETGQRLAGRFGFRPSFPELVAVNERQYFPPVEMVSVDDPVFGGWGEAQLRHFAEGGSFDRVIGDEK